MPSLVSAGAPNGGAAPREEAAAPGQDASSASPQPEQRRQQQPEANDEDDGDDASPTVPPGIVPIATPHAHDVLCTRGTHRHHAGNLHFRNLVLSHKAEYARLRARQREAAAQGSGRRLPVDASGTALGKVLAAQKGEIAARIVAAVRGLDPPGRFLRRMEEGEGEGLAGEENATGVAQGEGAGTAWVEIGDERAVQKAQQALRDGASDRSSVAWGRKRQAHLEADDSDGHCGGPDNADMEGRGPEQRAQAVLGAMAPFAWRCLAGTFGPMPAAVARRQDMAGHFGPMRHGDSDASREARSPREKRPKKRRRRAASAEGENVDDGGKETSSKSVEKKSDAAGAQKETSSGDAPKKAPEANDAPREDGQPTDQTSTAADGAEANEPSDADGAPAGKGAEKRRRVNGGKFCPLPADATTILGRWLDSHIDHPYATPEQMMSLVESTGLHKEQVKEWLKKARRKRGLSRRRGRGRRCAAMAEPADPAIDLHAAVDDLQRRAAEAGIDNPVDLWRAMLHQGRTGNPPAAVGEESNSGDQQEEGATKGVEVEGEHAKERPKRPLNAYLSFIKEALPRVKEAHPDLSQKEVMVKAAQAYRELGDEERKRYEDMAAAAMAKFREDHGADALRHWKKKKKKKRRRTGEKTKGQSADAARAAAPEAGPEAAVATDASSHPTDEDPDAAGAEKRKSGGDEPGRPASKEAPPMGGEGPPPSEKRRRVNGGKFCPLPADATTILRRWLDSHVDHPYATREQMMSLVESTGLGKEQVKEWLKKARRRRGMTRRNGCGRRGAAMAANANATKEGEATAKEGPKRPLNAYLSFMKEALPKMKERYPDISQKEVMTKAAKAYRELGDDERKRYEDAAAAARAKFREDHGEEAAAEEAKETKEGEATAKERPKRPLNAYLSFMKEALPKMKEAHPDITQKEVMAKAAKAYRELGDDERKRYEDMAAAAMAKFREEHGEEPPDPDGTLRDPRALPAAAATTLQWWLLSHRDRPSATPEQLASLMEATGLSESRVKKWLADARRQLGGQQRQWQQALTAGMMMNPVHAPPMMSHGMSGNLPFAAAMGSHIDAGTGQFAQGSFTAMPLDLNAMAGGMMNPVGVGRQEKRKRTGGRTGNDGSQLDKTWDELVASILPDKPKKPHTAYKLCYELERELKVREEFEVTEESEDCCDPDMPPRYKHLMLAKDWYKSLEEKPKFDEEVSQRIAELRWKEIDAKDPEVRPYCEKIAKAELDAYKEAMEEHERVCKNLERAATAGKKQELEKSHQNANDNKDGDGPVAADEVNTVEETNRMPWNEERHITYLC